jgi:hypothetical protein
MRSKIEVVGTFRLVLKFGLILDLENVFYVPSFSWNLISISRSGMLVGDFCLMEIFLVFGKIILLLLVEH